MKIENYELRITNLIILFLTLLVVPARAWKWWPLPMAEEDTEQDSLLYIGTVQALTSTGSTAPFLLQANRNGTISTAAHSGTLTLGISKPATRPHRWYDYDGAVLLTGQAHALRESKGTGYFQELYAHLRLYIVDITVGIHPMYFGCAEQDLTSGSLLFSNNTHPIPRVSVGIDRWTAFPGLFGYVEVKGGLTHGWLDDNNEYVSRTLLHHLYAGMRVGGSLPVNISYEYHHAAQWGGTSARYGDLGHSWEDYKRIFLAKEGGSVWIEQENAQGNHIGWSQFCVTAKGKVWHINMYWQAMVEDRPNRILSLGMNPTDGLWGVYVHQYAWRYISAFTFEFINTTDQSGPWHDKDGFIYGGRDDYYRNSIYQQGWTYFGRTIGSPLLSQTNTRVMAGYVGVKGDIYGFRYKIAAQYAKNYGRYTAPRKTDNTSLIVEVNKHVDKAWGLDFGLAVGVDFGSEYGTQAGAMITIRKQGLIKTY